jgi:hypothetical protein
MYSSGLKLGSAAILNKNPFFEMASKSGHNLPEGLPKINVFAKTQISMQA